MAKAKQQESPVSEGSTAAKSNDGFEEFVRAQQEAANANGMRDKHHPDMHYLGADANSCPRCDASLPSMRQLYEAR